MQAAAELANNSGATVVLNPAPAQPLPDELLQQVSILTPNETETELLTGIKVTDDASCARAAEILLGKGVKTVIITLGSRGAFVASRTMQQTVSGFKVQPVDTTAAGDTFNGALAVAIAEGLSMIDAIRFANAAAAISVTRMVRSLRRRRGKRSTNFWVPIRNRVPTLKSRFAPLPCA